MSAPSQWPLPENGIRFLTPAFMLKKLSQHPLTQECYPTAMGFYPSADRHRMERNSHNDNLLIYCVDGRGHATTDDWRGAIGPGNILLLPQETPHRYEADPQEPWTIYWVHYRGASSTAFNQYLGVRNNDSPLIDAGISPQLVAHFRGLLAVHRTGYNTRAFINASNQLRHLLTHIALEIRRVRASNQDSFNLEAVQNLMLEHIGETLDLDTLAAAANLSKYHFSNKYKALTGYSPIKHFLNMKMEHACHLLDSSQLSVKAVAAALGYEDPLYFSRQFSRTIGLSPRAYRRSVRS
ncbi:MAG: AraC family transcriptional regulator [Halioglobus sp.]|nr:AraC family transcriptional regulator [Halioglobus sp.]